MPDVIESWFRLPHRSIYVHNFATGLFLVSLTPLSYWMLALGLGYLHHLILDSATVRGCYIFRRRMKGVLQTRNFSHNVLMILVHVVFALIVVYI